MLYSVFHISRAFKWVDANFIFSQKSYVTLIRYDVMTQSHGKSRLASFRAEDIFRKSRKRNFERWSSCLSNRQNCALGVNSPPLGRKKVNLILIFEHCLSSSSLSIVGIICNTIFVSSHMKPENPERTQTIIGGSINIAIRHCQESKPQVRADYTRP